MRVVVTGANGQLGYCLQQTVPDTIDCVATGRDQLNLLQSGSLYDGLSRLKPDAVINTAAYTAVDKAEVERERAFAVNADSVTLLAEYCQGKQIPLIQISTDFVFNGSQSRPYTVDDKPEPLGIYGLSKQQGEVNALVNCEYTYIVRTGWVYAEHGANFVKTMLRLGQERDQLSVVADQVGTPTYARNLAKMIWRLVEQRPHAQSWDERIFHFSDAGVASWYDFAVAVFNEAFTLDLIDKMPQLKPIATRDFLTPAKRPAYSVLDKSHSWDILAIEPVYWRDALVDMLQHLKQQAV